MLVDPTSYATDYFSSVLDAAVHSAPWRIPSTAAAISFAEQIEPDRKSDN